jgi:hypothetical protein
MRAAPPAVRAGVKATADLTDTADRRVPAVVLRDRPVRANGRDSDAAFGRHTIE